MVSYLNSALSYRTAAINSPEFAARASVNWCLRIATQKIGRTHLGECSGDVITSSAIMPCLADSVWRPLSLLLSNAPNGRSRGYHGYAAMTGHASPLGACAGTNATKDAVGVGV